MKRIFIAFLLIFLDFNLNLDNLQIGLIPDFVGYIVMINGLVEMADESPQFIRVKPFATGMAIYTGILYFMDLAGISASLGALSYVLGIVSLAISLYISYCIVMGVKEMEVKYNTDLNGDGVKSMWTIMAILSVISYILVFVPALAFFCLLATIIMAICFLVAFNNSKNLYYEMPEPSSEPVEEKPDVNAD